MPQHPEAALRSVGWEWMLGEDTYPTWFRKPWSFRKLRPMPITKQLSRCTRCLWRRDNTPSTSICSKKWVSPVRYTNWSGGRGRDDRRYICTGASTWPVEWTANLSSSSSSTPIPPCLPETAVVQWAHLRANGFDDSRQFNTLYETLVGQFRYLQEVNPDLTPSLLLTTLRGYPEDDTNVSLLTEAAREAVRCGILLHG